MKINHFIAVALVAMCSILLCNRSMYAGPDPKIYMESVFTVFVPACDRAKDFDCIIMHLDTAFRIRSGEKNWGEAFDILVWKLDYAGQYRRLELYHQLLNEADELLLQHRNDLEPQVFEANTLALQLRSALYYYETGNWLSAMEKYRQLQEQLSKLPQKSEADWFNLASANLYLGAMSRGESNLDAAERYFLKALECQKEYQDEQEKLRGTALSHKHLGDLFLLKNNYDESQRHYEIAIGIYTQLASSNVRDIGLNKRNLNGLATSLLGLAKLQKTRGWHDLALTTLQRAEKTGVLKEDLYQRFGEVHAASRNQEKARTYFEQALQIRQQTFGVKHYKVAETLASIGDLSMQLNSPRLALEQYQQSLIALSDAFKDTSIAQNPITFQRTFISRDLLGVFAKKMDALFQLHKRGEQDHNYLSLAWETGLAAVAAIDSLKSSPLKSDEDKHRLLHESYTVYEKTLHIAAALGPDFHDDAFAIMEKSKSIVLLEAFQNANALHVAGIEDKLLEKEIRLKHQLYILEDSLLRRDVDGGNKTRMETRKARMKEEYRDLISEFQRNSPNYYQLKYAPFALSIQDVRQDLLTDGEALVEYFVGDSSIFVTVITDETLQLKEIKKTFPLETWVGNMLTSISAGNVSRPDSSMSSEMSAQQFTQTAWALYDAVFAPVAAGLPEKLIIIPDGALGYVPFEALLTAEITSHFTQYRTHPYLLNRHEISYCYSAALLRAMKKMQIGTTGVLAMAPVFKGARDGNNTLGNERLDSLVHNQDEAKAVVKAVGKGEAWVDTSATRQKFMALAPNFSILHIATHGILNALYSSYSYLAFTQNGQEPDSSRLYVRDFYTLRLNAAMVVLSACKTGLGEIKRGVGIISIAYGVIYSGAQSVVMTLWSVDATSTTEILSNFYDYLTDEHLSKSAALWAAKKEYLENQRDDFRAHPFFWAAYAPVGDMKAISAGRWWPWLLGVGAGAMGFFAWRRQRRGSRNISMPISSI